MGQLEDMDRKLTQQSEMIDRLCAKLGHEWDTYTYPYKRMLCRFNYGSTSPPNVRHFAEAKSEADHGISCEICGVVKCSQAE